MKALALEIEHLIENLRAAASLNDPAAIVDRIKEDLENFIPAEGLRLPEHYRRTRPDRYCRRLLHRDPDLAFTALVMTWGPGQRTALHDHAGIWCVEGVVEGELEVTRYELLEETSGGDCRFAEKGSVHARAGSAGALIPPFEHHVLANASADRIALTLHVYGGEMDHCCVFLPQEGGTAGTAHAARAAHAADTAGGDPAAGPALAYRRHFKQLTYDE